MDVWDTFCIVTTMTCDLCFVPALPSVRAHTFDVLIISNSFCKFAATILNLRAATL